MVDLDDELLEVIKETGKELAKREGKSKYLRVNGDVMLGTTIRRLLELYATPRRIVTAIDAADTRADIIHVTPSAPEDGWGFGRWAPESPTRPSSVSTSGSSSTSTWPAGARRMAGRRPSAPRGPTGSARQSVTAYSPE